jgi:hypothetical protein
VTSSSSEGALKGEVEVGARGAYWVGRSVFEFVRCVLNYGVVRLGQEGGCVGVTIGCGGLLRPAERGAQRPKQQMGQE